MTVQALRFGRFVLSGTPGSKMTFELSRHFYVISRLEQRARSLVLSGLVVATSSALLACKPPSTEQPTPINEAKITAHEATTTSSNAPPQTNEIRNAVKAYIDPVTGELREPTAAELASEAQATTQKESNSGKSSRQIVRADGSVEVLLDQSNDQAFKACVQKDGSVAMGHECEATSPPK